MILTICYVSSASEKLTNEDIEMLMTETKQFNNTNNISGVLIYSDLTFFQIIEGEYDIIKQLFESIEKDYRHYNIFKILERQSTEKKYKRFESKYITYNKKNATIELQKFLEVNIDNMQDKELHNFVISQSKILFSNN